MIRLAFAGTGYISKIHAQAAMNTPDVSLSAVVNHKPESMQLFAEQYDIPRQFNALEDLLAEACADAIVISTPNYLHASQAIAAMKAGLHVMVEKPMAMTASEASAMQEVSRAMGRLLMVAHCWRFDDEVLWLRDQIARGELGSIVRTKGYGVHVNWGPGGWFTEARYAGGGALADMGIHAIDTVRFLMGDPLPLTVYAHISTHYGAFDVDDTGLIVVTWDNGATSVIESGWWQPHSDGPEAGTLLYGKAGYARLFPTYLELRDVEAQAIKRVESGFAPVRDPHCPQSMYDVQMKYFSACIAGMRQPVPGAEEGIVNMQIVDAAYASNRTGEVITL